MECPKCKRVLKEIKDKIVNQRIPNAFICFNEKCEFFGIKRINPKWFEDTE